jgi:hypothetical protein
MMYALKVTMPHSLVLHHVPLLFCLVLAEMDLFLMVIPSAAVTVCKKKIGY